MTPLDKGFEVAIAERVVLIEQSLENVGEVTLEVKTTLTSIEERLRKVEVDLAGAVSRDKADILQKEVHSLALEVQKVKSTLQGEISKVNNTVSHEKGKSQWIYWVVGIIVGSLLSGVIGYLIKGMGS